jgi:isopenicillin N synthase-like dioxygenase
MSHSDIPIIDAELYLTKGEGWQEECNKVAFSFHKFGILKFKDPRVDQAANGNYIDMVERYFDHISKKFYAGETLEDVRPELCY